MGVGVSVHSNEPSLHFRDVVSEKKRALHTLKRALHILKRALHILKSALHTLQRTSHTFKEPHIHSHEPCIHSNEPSLNFGDVCMARVNTLKHTATHCSTLQHTATHCNTLQHKCIPEMYVLLVPVKEPRIHLHEPYIRALYTLTQPKRSILCRPEICRNLQKFAEICRNLQKFAE